MKAFRKIGTARPVAAMNSININILEELDYRQIPLGEISRRWCSEPCLGDKILQELKPGEGILMSSLFTEVEVQFARPPDGGLSQCPEGGPGLSWNSD